MPSGNRDVWHFLANWVEPLPLSLIKHLSNPLHCELLSGTGPLLSRFWPRAVFRNAFMWLYLAFGTSLGVRASNSPVTVGRKTRVPFEIIHCLQRSSDVLSSMRPALTALRWEFCLCYSPVVPRALFFFFFLHVTKPELFSFIMIITIYN